MKNAIFEYYSDNFVDRKQNINELLDFIVKYAEESETADEYPKIKNDQSGFKSNYNSWNENSTLLAQLASSSPTCTFTSQLHGCVHPTSLHLLLSPLAQSHDPLPTQLIQWRQGHPPGHHDLPRQCRQGGARLL